MTFNNSKGTGTVVWGIGSLILVALGGWILVSFCRRLGSPKDLEVGIPALLVYVTLVAIIAQIVVSRMQWQAMKAELDIISIPVNPRLRVTSVTAENFKPDRKPAFLVRIANEGATDAKNVTLHLRADSSIEHGSKWSREQLVTIPANDERCYPVQWKASLNNNQYNQFNNGEAVLQISGFYQLEGEEKTRFCYKYYPWRGERPQGVDQFFPCDFDPGLTILVTVTDTAITVEGQEVDLTVASSPNKQKEEDN